MTRLVAGALLALALAASARAGEIPGAAIVLEVAPGAPGSDPAGAPPRFVLLRDGQVFVGGTAALEAGRLDKRDAQALQKRAGALRRLPGASAPITFGGPADRALRLRVAEPEPFEIVASGDPRIAPASLAPIASLFEELGRFHHASLRPYAPAHYAIQAREAALVGGCRAWPFALALAEALAGPRSVPAGEVHDWPTGANPASVCVDEKRFVVTLRPLLPDERP